MSVINNVSDISITCGACGSHFSGQARYYSQLMEIFNNHTHHTGEEAEIEESD